MSRGATERVDALLRCTDAAPWAAAPAALHDRVMAEIDRIPVGAIAGVSRPARPWRSIAVAAAVAMIAGGLGLLVGASVLRPVEGTVVAALSTPSEQVIEDTAGAGVETLRPTVVLTRAFEDLRPTEPANVVASVAAPMRAEAAGLAEETRLAARAVLSRLPFVSME